MNPSWRYLSLIVLPIALLAACHKDNSPSTSSGASVAPSSSAPPTTSTGTVKPTPLPPPPPVPVTPPKPSSGTVVFPLTFKVNIAGQSSVFLGASATHDNDFSAIANTFPGARPNPSTQKIDWMVNGVPAGKTIDILGFICDGTDNTGCFPDAGSDQATFASCTAHVPVDQNLKPTCMPTFQITETQTSATCVTTCQ